MKKQRGMQRDLALKDSSGWIHVIRRFDAERFLDVAMRDNDIKWGLRADVPAGAQLDDIPSVLDDAVFGLMVDRALAERGGAIKLP